MANAADRLQPFADTYCRRCPVRQTCWAQPEQHGVWGGELRHRTTGVDLLVPGRPRRRLT